MHTISRRLFLSLLAAGAASAAKPRVGPEKGTLVVAGGGRLPDSIVSAFIRHAGGAGSLFVVIPTAGEAQSYDQSWSGIQFLTKAGVKRIHVLHTRDRKQADTKEFVKPLREAGGVWFSGGRQWRLVDSYLHTRAHQELWNVLGRGGVIGGSSAGATIQGSYLVRGAREGNTLMMAPGYEEGFGFLRNVAVDQHLLKRNRQEDLVAVVARHKRLLGIGIDESTAIVV
jgi:cyanophycinase